jgi:glycosyltransferase involved in cell wall biosynthesis
MIRVMQVLPNLGPGGAERMVVHLLRGLDSARFQTRLVSLFRIESDELGREARQAAGEARSLDKRLGVDLRMLARFDRQVAEFRPHVIHTHRYVLRYTLPSTLTRRPPVAVHTVHNVANREVDWAGRLLNRIALRWWVRPVAVADVVARSLTTAYGLRGIPTIPNGIPVDRYGDPRVNRSEWRKREAISESELVVVCIGRFAAQKNQGLLVDAFSLLSHSRRTCKLLFVGEGAQMAEVRQSIARLRLGDRVRLLGRRSDIPAVLAACDLVVQPSLWEGNPLSVMEAMAAGKAVVATSVGGVPDLIDHGVTGWLVPPNDVSQLESALTRLIEDDDLRAELGAHAAATARARFDVSVMTKGYEDLYESLL